MHNNEVKQTKHWADKNKPIQSIVERQIQVSAYKCVDEIIVYNTEHDVMEILKSVEWDVRILGDEYRNNVRSLLLQQAAS